MIGFQEKHLHIGLVEQGLLSNCDFNSRCIKLKSKSMV